MRAITKTVLLLGIASAAGFGSAAPGHAQYYPPPPDYDAPPPPGYYGGPPGYYGPPPGYYRRGGNCYAGGCCPPGMTIQGRACRPYRGADDGGWRTYNGCPPHYTVQDGVCKPYRGY